MSTESAPAPATGPEPQSRGGLTWRRVLLVAAAAAVVGMGGTGVAAYLVTGAQEKAKTNVDCGAFRPCIPSLKAATVLDALTQRGHECVKDENGDWGCKLSIGETNYEARVHERKGLINEYTARVSSPDGREVTPSKLTYLLWFAALPYGNDPILAGQIEGWLTEKVEKLESAQATIGGYRYDVEADKARNLLVSVMGVTG